MKSQAEGKTKFGVGRLCPQEDSHSGQLERGTLENAGVWRLRGSKAASGLGEDLVRRG
jgi:hypothetical protein